MRKGLVAFIGALLMMLTMAIPSTNASPLKVVDVEVKVHLKIQCEDQNIVMNIDKQTISIDPSKITLHPREFLLIRITVHAGYDISEAEGISILGCIDLGRSSGSIWFENVPGGFGIFLTRPHVEQVIGKSFSKTFLLLYVAPSRMRIPPGGTEGTVHFMPWITFHCYYGSHCVDSKEVEPYKKLTINFKPRDTMIARVFENLFGLSG